jgi:hypothetical protein
MSDFLGTPGPWTVDEEAFDNDGCPETVIRALNGVAGVAVAIDFGTNNPGMREANARLIAASPELFGCLQATFDAIGERLLDDVFGYEWLEKAKAALAKAKGTEP